MSDSDFCAEDASAPPLLPRPMRLWEAPSSGAECSSDEDSVLYEPVTAAPDPCAAIVTATRLLGFQEVKDSGCMYVAPWDIGGVPVIIVDGAVIDANPNKKKTGKNTLGWNEQCRLYLMSLLASIKPSDGCVRYHVIFIHPEHSFKVHLGLLKAAHKHLPHSVRKGIQSLTLVSTSSFSNFFVRIRIPFLSKKFSRKVRTVVIHNSGRAPRPVLRDKAINSVRERLSATLVDFAETMT